MNTYLYKKIVDKLQKIILINKKYKRNCILVSISAGQDSIYLIKLLETIKTNFLGILKLQYIYIDHQWKKNSKSQIKHIINYLKCFNSSLYIYQVKKNAIPKHKQEKQGIKYCLIMQKIIITSFL